MEKLKKIGNKIKELFIRIGKWAKTSKLNMSVTVSSSVILVLGIIIVIIISSRGGVDNKIVVTTVGEATAGEDIETTMPTPAADELFTTDIDQQETGNFVYEPSLLEPNLVAKMQWSKDGVYYTQYSVTVKNLTDETIDGWALVFRSDSSFDFTDNWNGQYSVNDNSLVVLPFPDNELIRPGEEINFGFVITSYKYIYFNTATVFVGDDYESFAISVHHTEPSTTKNDETTSVYENDETTTYNNETTTPEVTTEEEKTTTGGETANTGGETATTEGGTTTTQGETTTSEENDTAASETETTTPVVTP